MITYSLGTHTDSPWRPSKRGVMQMRSRSWVVFGLLASLAAFPPAAAGSGRRVAPRDDAIRFGSDLNQGLKNARVQNLPLFLAFGAVWCPVCRVMESTTLLEPSIQALAAEFVWVRIAIDRDVSLAQEWGVEATPTVFLLDPQGNPRLQIVGGASGDELAGLLHGFLEDLAKAAVSGEPVPAAAYEYTALTSKPGGFRGKSICFSHVGYGPLGIRSQSPFQSLRLSPLPRTPSTLARGEHQLRLGTTWVNLWAVEETRFDPADGVLGPYVVDSETFDLDLSYAYGLGDTVQIELAYEQRCRFGGILDGFIEGFMTSSGLTRAAATAGREIRPSS